MKNILLILVSLLVMLPAYACGGSDDEVAADMDGVGEGSVNKITQSERMFTIDDFLAVGFKKSKTYDVEGLEGAVEAHYGFFGPDPYNRLEYEVRLYPDHATAIGPGVSFADEATGEDAVILKNVQRWKKGLTQRRQCAGNGGHHSGKCDNAKYGDYIINGNMVLLCQGKDSSTAIQACNDLMDKIQ